MSNDCRNTLTINTDDKTLAKILDLVKSGDNDFDFERIIPMPHYIYSGSVGAEEKEIYGEYNWYDWSIKNWGTKWNSCNTYIDGNEVHFDTAWNPAYPVIERLAFLFPDVNFVYTGEELGCGFCFAREYRNGFEVYKMDGELYEFSFVNMNNEEKEKCLKENNISPDRPFEEIVNIKNSLNAFKIGDVYSYDYIENEEIVLIRAGEFFDARNDENPCYYC